MGSRDSSPQALGPLAEILKVVRLRDLRHLTNLLCLVDLDPELLHLLLQPLLTRGDLERHAVEDPGQVPELVGPPRDFRETLGIERVGLEGGGGGREPTHRPRHPAGQDHRGDQAHAEHAGGHHARQPQVASNRFEEALRRQMHDGCGDRLIAVLAHDRRHDLEHGPVQIASRLSLAHHLAELGLLVLGELLRNVLTGHRAVDERHDRVIHHAHRDDVAPGHQLLDQAAHAHPVPKMLQERGLIPDLHDPGLVDPGDGRVLEHLRVDLALARLLHHRAALAGQQRPENVGLRLLLGIGAEGEVHVGHRAQIGVSLLVGDPELAQHRVAGDGAQVSVDPFGLDSRRLGQRHQMSRDRRLHDHLLADGAFDLVRHLAGESSGDGEEPRQQPALGLGFQQQRVAAGPGQDRRGREHRHDQQSRHHQQRSRS